MLTDLFQATVIVSLLAATVRIATPLLLAAIGELVAERSGVYNMGLEGTMLMGALTACSRGGCQRQLGSAYSRLPPAR